MTEIFNKSEMRQIRRALRKKMPTPESVIWNKIRNRQLCNLKFRRQYSIDNFIVDFYCVEKKIAIEIDGDSHFIKRAVESDRARQEHIEKLGVRFFRFTNNEIVENIEGVIANLVEALTSPSLSFVRRGTNLTQPLLRKERDQLHLRQSVH